MRYTVLIFILLAGAANAETFECQTGAFWLDGYEIIVVATINEDGETGTIKVAGVIHQTAYRVEGFDRRWSFGSQDDGNFDYVFILQPDGTGIYYDFSSVEVGESVEGSQIFVCKKSTE